MGTAIKQVALKGMKGVLHSNEDYIFYLAQTRGAAMTNLEQSMSRLVADKRSTMPLVRSYVSVPRVCVAHSYALR